MKSKKGAYHFWISIVKSIVRLFGCLCVLGLQDMTGLILLVIHFGIAEILGILEEIYDARD